jgi:hypothetical protein
MRIRSSFGQVVTLGVLIVLVSMMSSGPTTMARDSTFTRGGSDPLWTTYEYQYEQDSRLSSTPAPGIKPNNLDKTAKNQDTLHSQSVKRIPKAGLRKFGYALLILLGIITLGALFRRWKTFV